MNSNTLAISNGNAELEPIGAVQEMERRVVALWLHDKSPKTQTAYRRDILSLFHFTKKTLAHTTLADLQAFSDDLKIQYADESRKRILNAVKSLFTFASSTPIGNRGIAYLRMNAAAALKIEGTKDRRNERILTVDQVKRIIDAAGDGKNGSRNKLMLQLLYWAGLRAEELSNLRWRDLLIDGKSDGGLILNIFGKGKKNREVWIDANRARLLLERRLGAENDFVFSARINRGISPCQIWRIVKAAVVKAGIRKEVSTHWLRHAFATHAIENGADPENLQRDMGHSSAETTRRYVHRTGAKSSSSYIPKF